MGAAVLDAAAVMEDAAVVDAAAAAVVDGHLGMHSGHHPPVCTALPAGLRVHRPCTRQMQRCRRCTLHVAGDGRAGIFRHVLGSEGRS